MTPTPPDSYRRPVRIVAALALVATCVLPVTGPRPAQAEPTSARPNQLGEQLRSALDGLHFAEVLDTDPVTTTGSARRASIAHVDKDARARVRPSTADAGTARPISQQPQIDATVIELDEHNRPTDAATVLMSPQYPHGVVVPIDRNLHTSQIRYRQWDDAGWYTNHGQGTIDVLPNREHARYDFMSPYPGSELKLMATLGVLRLVDRGEIRLNDTYRYAPTEDSSLCGPATTNTVRGYIDAAITYSSNGGGCALIKLLWDHGAVDELNALFQSKGLETLQLKETNPANGGHWDNPITMSSLDTAKLMTLLGGAPATAWRTPTGQPVGRVLRDSSRRFFLSELAQQGWNDQLTTTIWCGATYPAPGIPSLTAPKWIGRDGTETIDGTNYGHDVRPCNRRAQVLFAHKTGWVGNTANDAGIVWSLPGRPHRHYVISVFTNLGTQYQDPQRPVPAPGGPGVSFTQKLAQFGRIVDGIETRRSHTG